MANDGTVATWHTRPIPAARSRCACARHAAVAALARADRLEVDADGRRIAARSLQLEEFLPVNPGNQHYPRIVDLIRYYTIDKVLFRFTRGA